MKARALGGLTTSPASGLPILTRTLIGAFLLVKMEKTITVWYNQMALSIFKAVADALDLSDGEVLQTEKRFWEMLGANASYGISLCEHKLQTKPN